MQDHDPAGSAALDEPVVVGDGDFAGFYREHYRRVAGLVFSLTGDWGTAEELTQDTFVVMHRTWDSVRRHPRPDLLVRRAAVNRTMSQFRRKRAERRAVERVAAHERAVDEPAAGPPPLPSDLGWLLDHVRRLPANQAKAVVLVHVEHLDHADAAAILGCSPSTLRTHLHRGCHALRSTIDRGA